MILWYCRLFELDFRILAKLKSNFQMGDIKSYFGGLVTPEMYC